MERESDRIIRTLMFDEAACITAKRMAGLQPLAPRRCDYESHCRDPTDCRDEDLIRKSQREYLKTEKMLKEKKSQRYRCKFITQTVMAFLECLKPKHSPSSSDMAKDEARNEKEEDASSNKTTARSLNLARKRKSKPMASSGKRGGVNTYDM